MPILIVFLILVAAEIFLFITVGGQIGAWATIGLIFGSSILGGFILKIEGIRIIQRAQQEINQNRKPVKELAHGAALALAAILLLTPGFISDTLGILLLLPPVRHFLIQIVIRQIAIRKDRRRHGDAIDGDYKVINDEDDNEHPSP